jgi:hypothetical protein
LAVRKYIGERGKESFEDLAALFAFQPDKNVERGLSEFCNALIAPLPDMGPDKMSEFIKFIAGEILRRKRIVEALAVLRL